MGWYIIFITLEYDQADFQQNGHYLTAGELVGKLSDRAAKELGLVPGIAVGSGVIDAYAGWIGTVGAKGDLGEESMASSRSSDDVAQAFTRLAAVAGTSTCHLAMSPKPVFVNGVWGPYRDVLLPNYWMAEGGQSATGELLKHIIETHPAHKDATQASNEAQTSIYDYLNSQLQRIAKEQNAPHVSWIGRHLFFYGDLFGNRSPIADPNMRGSIVGLSSDKSIGSLALMYYGAMEFIALQTRQIIERMNDSGHHIQSIFMSGSLCQNDILMDLMSTACDMPVVIPKYIHAAVVHGAAMLGAKAASEADGGQGEDLWSIMKRMSTVGKTVHPSKDKGLNNLLDAKYVIFLEQCKTQQQWRKDVDGVIEGWKS
jgi:FGGY-family pentulose kinase